MVSSHPAATRRTVLGTGAAVAASLGVGLRPAQAAQVPRDPFTLGVASGDPTPDGFVLWTRLARQPLAPDGHGGMPRGPVQVQWQVATDRRFSRILKRGVAEARWKHAHSIHVEVGGLEPGREYWYRFRAQGHVSRRGRALTAPLPLSMPASLAMSFASCAEFEHGWFTAYRRLAEDRPDLVLHLGDYQYEYAKDTFVAATGNVRDHNGPETTTLAGYRQRHAQYKTDPDLQAAHAIAPWLVVWDDHELASNWADEVPEVPDGNFLARRAAAFRAFYENMPLRSTSAPAGIDLQLYRRVQWGQLATFHLLDTRQYRDDQGCGDGFRRNCEAAGDPTRSITGPEQERWLLDGFQGSTARWDLLAQQVFFAQRDADIGPDRLTSMDAWDGYLGSRERVARGWVDAGVRNPVVLTGDTHAHWAADLKLDYDDPGSPVIGSELACSSITSGGDGADSDSTAHPWFPWNPHLRFQNGLRGYVRTTITPETVAADYRCVRRVSVAGEPVFTRASFAIADGVRGLQPTFDQPPTRSQKLRGDDTPIRDTIAWETERP